MKITCDFCKTEYSLDRAPAGALRCAICGHVWAAPTRPRRNALLLFIAALCAALSAIVFTVVVIAHHQASRAAYRPLVAQIAEIKTVIDASGAPHFVVSGTVLNQSNEIYGVPDLIIVSRDENGNPISKQKFMPSATLLDAGASVEFSHTLSAPVTGVRKITVELQDAGDTDA